MAVSVLLYAIAYPCSHAVSVATVKLHCTTQSVSTDLLDADGDRVYSIKAATVQKQTETNSSNSSQSCQSSFDLPRPQVKSSTYSYLLVCVSYATLCAFLTVLSRVEPDTWCRG